MARKTPPRADVTEALALMQEGRVRGQGRRSPILLWMLKNREALERGFQETAPSWERLAKYLGDHGVMDGDGKRPTAIATRQAWYRARTIATPKKRPQVAATPARAPSSAAGISAPADGDTQTPEPERFAFATLRNHTPASAPSQRPSRAAPVKRDAEAAIKRLIGDKPRRGFRPPEDQED